MACFIIPATEAIVVTTISKALQNKEKKNIQSMPQDMGVLQEVKIPMSQKLQKLSNFLWGGSALLMFEHIWHGEVSLFFPFLTAASNPADFTNMLHEMSTVGVTMAVVVTIFWGALTYIEAKVKGKETVTL